MKIDKCYFYSDLSGAGRPQYYTESKITFWGNKKDNYVYDVKNSYLNKYKTVYAIFSTDWTMAYSGNVPREHGMHLGMYMTDLTSGFGEIGINNDSEFVNSWGNPGIPHYTLNNDSGHWTGRQGIISTSKNLNIRWSSEEGIDIDNMIRKYRAPIYVMEDINKLKEKRQNLIS